MKKIMKVCGLVVVSAVLIVAAVFAANTLSTPEFDVTGSVSFTANTNVAMKIVGNVSHADTTTPKAGSQSYEGATYDESGVPKLKATDWVMGDLKFTGIHNKIVVTMTFTNEGTVATSVTITSPAAVTNTALTLKTGDSAITLAAKTITTNVATENVAVGESIMFEYTLELTALATVSIPAFNFHTVMAEVV